MVKRAKRTATPLEASIQERLRVFVRHVGEHRAAEKIGVTATVIARAMSGFGIRRGTAVAIEARLDLLEPIKTINGTKSKTKGK